MARCDRDPDGAVLDCLRCTRPTIPGSNYCWDHQIRTEPDFDCIAALGEKVEALEKKLTAALSQIAVHRHSVYEGTCSSPIGTPGADRSGHMGCSEWATRLAALEAREEGE